MDVVDKLEEKQELLRNEILGKNYDGDRFIDYIISKREDGGDLKNWTLEELKTMVSRFQKDEKNIY